MGKVTLILSVIWVLCACASQQQDKPKSEIENYMSALSSRIEPAWKKEVATRVKRLARKGLTPIGLPSPKNELFVSIGIARDGAIKEITPTRKSHYEFLNQAALQVLSELSHVESPPESCLKNDLCHLEWRFVVVK